ncbi:hypothetical protein EDC01DRAFT_631316 [Geopyxis carbonaria]|nr:hypothetical protein EDC01DRAFT_631316 [Geopyxis carbonaria]
MAYLISLSKDFLPPPFGNPYQRNGGFTASSPRSLSKCGLPSHEFECMISKSTSHTLVTKFLVDSFNSLCAPFQWVESKEWYFNEYKRPQITSKSPELVSNDGGYDDLKKSFKFTPFNDTQQKRYKFEYFLENQTVLERAHQLKVIGSFDFCFCFTPNGTQRQHYFRVEKALVIDGELFPKHPDWSYAFPSFPARQTEKGTFSAVLGRNFIENHPYIMYELGGESDFVFSSNLLASRTDGLRRETTRSGTNLLVHTRGICENDLDHAVGSVTGGYGIFFESKSIFNVFRHVPGPSIGAKDSTFERGNEDAVGFGNAPPKEPPTIERVELAAVIQAMKITIRLKIIGYHFDSAKFRHSSKYCSAVFNEEVQPGIEPRTIKENKDLIQDFDKVRCVFPQQGLTVNFEEITRQDSNPAYILADLAKDMWPYTGAMTMVLEPHIPVSVEEYEIFRNESRTPSPISASFEESPGTANERFNFPRIQTDIFPATTGRSRAGSMSRSRSSSIDTNAMTGDSPILQMKKYVFSRNLLPTGRIMGEAARGNLLALTSEGLYFVPMHKAFMQMLAADRLGHVTGEEDDEFTEGQIETIGVGIGKLSVFTTGLDGIEYY